MIGHGWTARLRCRFLVATVLTVSTSVAVAAPAQAGSPVTCDVQQIALVDVPRHVAVEPEGYENLLAALRVSEGVTLRAWQVEGGGGGLLVALIDAGTRQQALESRGSFIDGFVSSSGAVPQPLALPPDRDGVDGVLIEVQGVRFRAVSTVAGRLVVSVVTITPELDLGEIEVPLLLDLLDMQLERVPADCSKDAPRRSVSDSQQLGVVVGSALFTGLLLWGAPTLIAWLADPTARRRRGDPRTPDASSSLVPHDVTAAAARRVARSRSASVGLLVGIAIASLSTLAFARTNRWYLLFIPLGLVVGTVASRVIARASGTRAPGTSALGWLRHGRRRLPAAVAVALSWCFLGLGLLGVSHYLWITTLTDNQRLVYATLAGMDEAAYRNLGLMIAFIMFVLAGVFYRFARWLGQRRAQDLVATDDRPPVLLLRSFQDDAVKLRVRAHRLGMTEIVHLRRRERLEELLVWTLASVGPVTTVADPNRRRTPLGAARERIAEREWLPIVQERISGAGLIVVVIGSTEGLLDELEAIRALGRLDRTLFVIPPVASGAAQRWARVAAEFGLDAQLDIADSGTVLIRVDAARRPHAYFGQRRDAPTYQAAIAEALTLGVVVESAPAP